MDKKQIESLVRGIVAKHLPKVSPDKITLESEYTALGVDSLALSWILADIEDTFELEMQVADVMKLKTLAASIDYVERRLGG